MESRNNWNRKETILALDLYFRVPFGSISRLNPKIQQLAKLIGRTNSAVSRKMGNLAHCDPVLRARGRVGLSNNSHLDEEIFKEFYNHTDKLAIEAELIREEYISATVLTDSQNMPMGLEKLREVKTRVGQQFFREAVLGEFENRCCITGIDNSQLLIASHIKPWADCNEKEKTSPDNGLCLNALHDKAFDCGLITISKEYKVIVSKNLIDSKMDDDTRDWLMSYNGATIELPDHFIPRKYFIEYHNSIIFQH